MFLLTLKFYVNKRGYKADYKYFSFYYHLVMK